MAPDADVGFERVERLLHGLAAAEPREVRDEKCDVDGGGFVLVDPVPLLRGEAAAVEIVRVEVDHRAADAAHETVHDRALARAGTASEANQPAQGEVTSECLTRLR